jgi:hypothetical protein
MNDQQHSDMVQQMSGQVRSMFYLVDEPTTLMLHVDGQTFTARASGQLTLTPGAAAWRDDLRDAARCSG